LYAHLILYLANNLIIQLLKHPVTVGSSNSQNDAKHWLSNWTVFISTLWLDNINRHSTTIFFHLQLKLLLLLERLIYI